jgi:uncharacterized membrane protein YgcG
MKGIKSRWLAGAVLVGPMTATGCYHYQKCVDPCWPERYNSEARTEVIASFAPQVQNGHVLDQTLYNNAFEPGTDRLTAGGMDQLDVLTRRRPMPDPRIFLATARDIVYDSTNPEALVEARVDLDNKRAAAVQRYVSAQTAGRPEGFEIIVHDPMPVGDHADPVNRSIRLYHNGSTGSLSGGASATTASSTGASGGGGGGGGGAGGGQGGGGGGQGQPSQSPQGGGVS